MIGDNANAMEPLLWGLLKYSFFLALAVAFARVLYRPFFTHVPVRRPLLMSMPPAVLMGVMQVVRGGSVSAGIAQGAVTVLVMTALFVLERRKFPSDPAVHEAYVAPPD